MLGENASAELIVLHLRHARPARSLQPKIEATDTSEETDKPHYFGPHRTAGGFVLKLLLPPILSAQ